MSMTAEEILLNCEKHFSFIATEIESLIVYIKNLLANCKRIDNSKFYEDKILSLIDKLVKQKEDFKKNTIDREMNKDTHIAIETYNEIQKYAEGTRDLLAELKLEAFSLKRDIVSKEQDMIFQSLNINKLNNLKELEHKLMISYEQDTDKLFIKNFFEDKKEVLINLNNEEVISLLKKSMVQENDYSKVIEKEIISSAIEIYKNDIETINILKEEMKNVLEKSNSRDTLLRFYKNFLKRAENESIRRDNITKIIKAVTDIGYIVNENDIRKIKEKNIVVIHATNKDGKTADFAVKFDGSLIYNWEGFEEHEHDEDAKAFLKKLREYNILHSDEYKKVYREPNFIKEAKLKVKQKQDKKEK
ncbi:hypothetical protein SCORR_v1c08940 [Spiroplasma corruscae]|uniref:Uncharacterized protein n=1 Tax=Spiroplasma corruscae TaxID=216934 RepID=A0A222EQJ0_9MOLU|nr:hypothetical protein [Spiroplasma corruscae]ASP28666.1 hypothetical protein SCORR_v1c08940 [Spiroplasma corruscae]